MRRKDHVLGDFWIIKNAMKLALHMDGMDLSWIDQQYYSHEQYPITSGNGNKSNGIFGNRILCFEILVIASRSYFWKRDASTKNSSREFRFIFLCWLMMTSFSKVFFVFFCVIAFCYLWLFFNRVFSCTQQIFLLSVNVFRSCFSLRSTRNMLHWSRSSRIS